ncbi:hypothetical protein IP92_04954 [Pseudoduganella flava]|uniref:Uncharacterized protein n=1 Tax=Pseudoduganella flava TaxID=871742 RepID=A0A562PGL8_9BURK|nr:hypothetical protein [Pseudoduganella flava]QGZ40212.1 hypothetical protein GO485_14920 [Pseudoduganella flava]TWI43390.1 hypothetical protein IP92_04954 [Pseudoduganella flava]
MIERGAAKLRMRDLRIVAAIDASAAGRRSGYAILAADDKELGFFTSYGAAIRAMLDHFDGVARLAERGRPQPR